MRRILFYALCSAAMFGVYLLVKFAVIGVSPDFGYGFVIGGFTLALLFWANERIDRTSKGDH